jgi:hypothetical protein
MKATWKPHEKHGRLTTQSDLPDSVYAFPKQRKEPLTDARHVRNAIARLDQVTGVSDDDRALAFANIKKAAEYYDVELSESSWTDVGVHPQRRSANRGAKKSPSAKKATSAKKSAKKSTASTRTPARKKTATVGRTTTKTRGAVAKTGGPAAKKTRTAAKTTRKKSGRKKR